MRNMISLDSRRFMMIILDAGMVAAVAALITSISALVWSLRRRV
jgi:hypothetical protein